MIEAMEHVKTHLHFRCQAIFLAKYLGSYLYFWLILGFEDMIKSKFYRHVPPQ
jgi:hypothetical protein